MLDESADGEWFSRRNPGLRRPVAELGRLFADGIPYLATEVQLFSKSGRPRPKDEQDFTAVLPVLDAAQRRWLADALGTAHPWHDRLIVIPGR